MVRSVVRIHPELSEETPADTAADGLEVDYIAQPEIRSPPEVDPNYTRQR
jgi:hypothetical protein